MTLTDRFKEALAGVSCTIIQKIKRPHLLRLEAQFLENQTRHLIVKKLISQVASYRANLVPEGYNMEANHQVKT